MRYPYLKRLPEFTYWAPQTVEEALDIMAQHHGEVKPIAGGTDLLIKMKKREETPRHLVGLKNIPGLDEIRYDRVGGLLLGPLVTVHAIEASDLIKENYPILSQAAATLGSVQVRNLATVAGNLCSALPSADMAPGLIVLEARLKTRGLSGERCIFVEDFFKEPGVNALLPDELVLEVGMPVPPKNCGMVYLKHMLRSAMDLSIVGVAALIAVENGICTEARIALGTVGPTPMRAIEAEKSLKGQHLEDKTIAAASEAASLECNPRSSMRASAEYRREMVRVLVEKVVREAGEGIRRSQKSKLKSQN